MKGPQWQINKHNWKKLKMIDKHSVQLNHQFKL